MHLKEGRRAATDPTFFSFTGRTPMKLLQLLMVITVLLIAGRGNAIAGYERRPDGVLFELTRTRPTDPGWLRIQVCTPEIIRVVAAPESTFSSRPSIMVEKTSWDAVPWDMREDAGKVLITTGRMAVRVDPLNGSIAFEDLQGRPILQERAGGGKSLTPAEVLGERTSHSEQVFTCSPGEAYYGLGAHQNGIMNYRGHDVDLWQYNIVDVVPFLVSSRNYGILWDNNSRTHFGDPRDYGSIEGLKLYDKDGQEGALTAEYFRDSTCHSLFATRREQRIAHDFLDVNDPYPAGFPDSVKTIVWSGQIESRDTGVHKFRLYSSWYTKMWLDGKLVVDAWRQNWLPWTHLMDVPMQPGKRHTLRIEWVHGGGYIGLTWLPPDPVRRDSTITLTSAVADQIDYYFIHGGNMDQVIHGYRSITGKAPMMPRWALGLWQSRERYRTQDEVLSVVKEFRKRNIPLDNIVQDWFYWKEDQWGSHEFDAGRFPDPAGMVQQLHKDLHAHIMITVWPKFYVGTKNYDELQEHGWLYTRNVEKGQRDWVGPGYLSTFYDPYSAEARSLYWKRIEENLFSKGFDAWWLDSTEPDMQSNLSPTEIILRMGPTAMGSGSRYLNTFSLMNAKGIYENQRAAAPDQRVFILTRSAFAGQQRYAAATWSGDVAARWVDLRNQVAAGVNFGLSGCPWWTTDIGGFAVEPRYERPSASDLDEWRELMTRWFQFGTFCPLFRVHGQFPLREMYEVAPESHPAYQAMLSSDRLRYRLMPYLYSLAGMVTHKDYTILRGLIMDFGEDRKVYGIGDQFMFGPALLINPVTAYKTRNRSVYLPAGSGWYDLQSGRYQCGGRSITARAPYANIPVFVREGSILPCGPALQYTGEKQADTIRLFVFTGRDGSFPLYEDEDVNYNYEKGLSATIPLTYDEHTRTLTIGKREGEFPGMLRARTFEVVWIGKGSRTGLDFTAAPHATVTYSGEPCTIKMKRH
jgi:alpha-D-xyloside xylohydrolase